MSSSAQSNLYADLSRTVSPERLGTYLTAAGFDQERALRLYLWNAQLGEAFYMVIQGVEIGLRNSVSAAFTVAYGADWWRNPRFLTAAGAGTGAELEAAKRRILNRGKAVSTPQIIASLSFGFWVHLLARRFNPGVWSAHFVRAFPQCPRRVGRQEVERSARRIAELRNRISRHEPIFRMNLSAEHHAAMELLSWICPVKAAWLRPHSRVPMLLRAKP